MQPSGRYLLSRFNVASGGRNITKICLRYPVSRFDIQFVFKVFKHCGVLLDILLGKLWVFLFVESFIRFFIGVFLIFPHIFHHLF